MKKENEEFKLKRGRIRERRKWLWRKGESRMNLGEEMMERDEICLRNRKSKRKGKILSENEVKMGRNAGEIEGLTMEGLEAERGR